MNDIKFEKDRSPEERFLHNVFARITKMTKFGEDSVGDNNSGEMTAKRNDIRYIPVEAIPGLPLGDDYNCLLIGSPDDFGDTCGLGAFRLVPDIELRPLVKMSRYLGGNIVSVVRSYDDSPLGYFVGNCNRDDLAECVAAISEATEEKRRAILQQMLLSEARSNPERMRAAIKSLHCDDGSPSLRQALGGVACAIGVGVLSLITPGPMSDATLGEERKSRRSPKKRTHTVPDHDDNKYKKEQDDATLKALSNINTNDAVRLLRLVAQNPKAAKNMFDFESWPAAKQYRLHVVRRRSGNKDFSSSCNYCLYYSKGRGPKIPIKFAHNPAYCIYLMYVIDRAKRGSNAGPLNLCRNKEEFIKLYMVVYGITYKEAHDKYEKANYRKDENEQFLRGGRNNDYMTDIDNKIVEKLGDYDSFLLKPGFKGFISIRPENIELDENLKNFNFQ